MERLQKIIAQAGVASRRKAEELIVAGKVTVNGKVVQELGFKVTPGKDKIVVEGKPIRSENKVYILLNKPVGYVSTLSDEKNRRKVTDLLKSVKERVYPVGRLDIDTEGLLLLTNDGDLAYGLTHPKHKVDKTYLVLVDGVPTKDKLQQLAEGVELEDGLTAPAKVKMVEEDEETAVLEITIHEGRNRQVRRMCTAIGHEVIALRRTQLAFLTLQGVSKGKFRYLKKHEVRQLKALTEPTKQEVKPCVPKKSSTRGWNVHKRNSRSS